MADTDEDRGGRGGIKVILDTNALMMQPQFGVEVFDEVERLFGESDFVVPRAVVSELRSLAGEDDDARIALDLVDECRIEGGRGDADDVIMEMAEDSVVVTNDTRLKNRLLENNVPVAYMRQKSYLDVAYP